MAEDSSRSSLELLYNISRELATSLDLHTVLPRVLLLSVHNLNAERGSLIVLDEKQKPLDAAIVVNDQLIQHTVERIQATLEQGLAGWVLRERKAALVPDTSQDARWLRRFDDTQERTGAKSAMCIPLLAGRKTVGILTIVHPVPGFFNQDHLALLQAIADQAGIAINNALLFTSLESATRRYRELFDDNLNPLLISNWEGKIVEANRAAARLTAYSPAQLATMNVATLHRDGNSRLAEYTPLLRAGETISYETELLLKSGKAHPVEVYVQMVTIEGLEHLQWTLRDISERKALETMRENLLAMIYHDLRSPLSNIVSSLDMIETMITPQDEAMEAVFTIAHRSIERMQRLIDSLLDIHRLEAGQPIVNQKAVEVLALVNYAVEAVRPVVQSKQQSLTVKALNALPLVQVDEDMVRRVLINLLENAARFTPLEGMITISGEQMDEWVRLCVEDSGPGIPKEAQELIFDKFARLDTERYPRGIGLGLAFCRLAIRAHGGKIWVESTTGQGSRFYFTLPVARPG